MLLGLCADSGHPPTSYNSTLEEAKVSGEMLSYWTNFACEGDPTPPGGLNTSIYWNPTISANPEYLLIDTVSKMEYSEEFRSRVEFWNRVYGKIK